MLQYDWNEAEYVQRPSYWVYRAMVEHLDGFDNSSILSEDMNSFFGYAFQRGAQTTWVFWAVGAPRDITLAMNEDVVVTRLPTSRGTGVTTEGVPSISGRVTLSLTTVPILVTRP